MSYLRDDQKLPHLREQVSPYTLMELEYYINSDASKQQRKRAFLVTGGTVENRTQALL